MINKANGELIIGNTVLSHNLSREDFLTSDLGAEVFNESNFSPCFNYYLNPQKIGEETFMVAVYFNPKGFIKMVALRIKKDGEISSYSNWSKEKEMEKKRLHDNWLLKHLGPPPYEYRWGRISSIYDSRSASSEILIRYYE